MGFLWVELEQCSDLPKLKRLDEAPKGKEAAILPTAKPRKAR
jgi:hypothetical protein